MIRAGQGDLSLRGALPRLLGAAFLSALLSAGAAGPVFCGAPDGGRGISAADPGAAPILAALGRASWIPSEPLRTFSADNLYEEINGEAELYLPYDVRVLTVAILKSAYIPGVELRLETYRHATTKDAYGIFSQYRYPGQEIVRVGPSEAAFSETSLDFFRGDTFVRIRVVTGTLSRASLLSMGRTVVAAIDGPSTAPPGAAVVNIPSAVAGTVIYQKKAMLGYEPLAPGYEARFEDGPLSGKAIFMEGGVESNRDRLTRALPGFRAVADDEWRAALPQGTLYLKAAGAGTVGVLGKISREQAAPILDSLVRNAAAALR